MENDSRSFTPTFTGAPHFRLPFRSVFMPIVPCVLDGCLSLLELIAKLEYIVNQYHDAIEANHTDIVNLAAYIDGALDDLREYIDTQDAATLASAKAYTDSAIDTLKAYVDDQDAATLALAKAYTDAALVTAKAYTDAEIASLKAYTDAQLALKQDLLTFDQTPTDGSTNPVESQGIKNYVDALRAYTDAQLALKQNLLTFDQTPTAGSTNPVESQGIKNYVDALSTSISTALTDKQPKNVYCELTYNSSTSVWSCSIQYTDVTAYLQQNRLIILRGNNPANPAVRESVQYFYFSGFNGVDTYTFSGENGYFTVSQLGGWTYTARA